MFTILFYFFIVNSKLSNTQNLVSQLANGTFVFLYELDSGKSFLRIKMKKGLTDIFSSMKFYFSSSEVANEVRLSIGDSSNIKGDVRLEYSFTHEMNPVNFLLFKFPRNVFTVDYLTDISSGIKYNFPSPVLIQLYNPLSNNDMSLYHFGKIGELLRISIDWAAQIYPVLIIYNKYNFQDSVPSASCEDYSNKTQICAFEMASLAYPKFFQLLYDYNSIYRYLYTNLYLISYSITGNCGKYKSSDTIDVTFNWDESVAIKVLSSVSYILQFLWKSFK